MQAGNRRGLVDREELITWGQASLDIFWLRDQSLEESDYGQEARWFKTFQPFKPFKPLKVLRPRKFVEDLEAALEQFREIAADLGGEVVEPEKS
jgi:type I restriction enzyme M protein